MTIRNIYELDSDEIQLARDCQNYPGIVRKVCMIMDFLDKDEKFMAERKAKAMIENKRRRKREQMRRYRNNIKKRLMKNGNRNLWRESNSKKDGYKTDQDKMPAMQEKEVRS